MTTDRQFHLYPLFVATLIMILNSTANAAMTTSGEMILVPEYVKAESMVVAEDFEGAIPLLNETLKQQPGHASAFNLLGYAHRRLGKFDQAEQYYEGALTLNPDHTGALNYMGQLFIQTGRPEKAKSFLMRLQKACPDGCGDLEHLEKAVASGVAGNY